MKFLGFEIRSAEKRSVENPSVSLSSAEAWNDVFNSWSSRTTSGATVTIENALGVPAVWAAVSFLSRTLASLPLHVYRKTKDGPVKVEGGLQTLIHECPNPEWTSFNWRAYSFWQTFTGGRQATWIERGANGQPVALWPLEPAKVEVSRVGGKRFYTYTDNGGKKVYPAADVIDVPFALDSCQLKAISPIIKCREAIGLAMDMETYAAKFFAGGGLPPLALEGPMPAGGEAMGRAAADIKRAIDHAKNSSKPFFPIPPGYKFTQVGFDPEKGQMTDARRFQVEEIARAYQLPPVFLQDLTHGTFSNSEQQDIFFVKHLVAQWAQAFEQECNLKLFGQRNGGRYVEHNLDGLQRGDFKSRIEALARGVQSGLITPNEGRALENRQDHENPAADELFMQGATVKLGTEPQGPVAPPPANGGTNDDGA